MIRKCLLFLLLFKLIFAININNENYTRIITSFDEYKKVLQKEGEKALKQELIKQIQKANVLLDKKDFDKIYNKTKEKIEAEMKKKLENLKEAGLVEDFPSFSIPYVNIVNDVKNLSIKNVTKEFNTQLQNSIMSNLGLGIHGLFGHCCCANFINYQIKSLINYAVPKIKTEIKLIDKIAKKINNIVIRDDKFRFQENTHWQSGQYGKIIDSQLTQVYYLNQIIKENTINKQLVFLNNKAINLLEKSKILTKKINLIQKVNNGRDN